MSEHTEHEQSDSHSAQAREPHRVRLPGFTADTEVGLGDVIKRGTSAVGIKPCGGCAQRAAALNRRFVISGRRSQR